MFSIVKKTKAVKDLIISKLDNILSRLLALDDNIKSLTENDTSLLQTSIHLVETWQQERYERKQQYQVLLQKLESLEQQTKIYKPQHQALQSDARQNQTNSSGLSESTVKVKTDQYSLINPEVGLMAHLYSYLPSRNALDIGANAGEVSERLLQSGYEVYAFEPFPPVFDRLCNRLSDNRNFHPSNLAIGSTDTTMELHIATDFSSSNKYKDSTLFNSLIAHSMPDNLTFTSTLEVPVRSLESLHSSLEIPSNIGLAKIDTEGFDLEVIRGMGEYRYPVVITEFWDSEIVFARSRVSNKLEDTVKEMRQRSYHWHIVIYRIYDSSDIAFYCNHAQSVSNSWGNAFFFQDRDIFTQALKWCSAALPVTYFN